MTQATFEMDFDDVEITGDGTDETNETDVSETEETAPDETDGTARKYLCLASALNREDLLDPVPEVLRVARDETGVGLDDDECSEMGSEVAIEDLEYPGRAAAVRGGAIAWLQRPGQRDRVDDALDVCEEMGSVEILVVDKIETLGATPASIRERIVRVLSLGWDVLLVRSGLRLIPGTEGARTALNLLLAQERAGLDLKRETTVADIEDRIGSREHHGRAPLGFDVKDGELVPSDNYDEVCAVLTAHQRDPEEMTKGKAARKLDTTRRTINRCLRERREMYGLDA